MEHACAVMPISEAPNLILFAGLGNILSGVVTLTFRKKFVSLSMRHYFIHQGSSIFKQFQDVEVPEDFDRCAPRSKIFDSLGVEGKKYPIDKIFLGWAYSVFLTGEKLYYCGLKNDSFGTFMISQDKIKDKVVKVACGWRDMLIVTEYGGCYWSETNSLDLTKVDVAGVKARDVAIGDKHSIVLTDNGKIYALKHTDISAILMPVKLRTVVTAVECGKDYVLLLSLEGRVFTYGNGSRGQLGHGDTDPKESPTLVEALDGIRIKSVSAGGWHAAVVSDIGDLYVWGWNESGQLGLPSVANPKRKVEEIVTVQCTPEPVDFGHEITVTSVSCGSRHTAITSDAGTVWAWGWNAYGQLGASEEVCLDKPQPVEVPSGFCVSEVKCAYWSTLIISKYTL